MILEMPWPPSSNHYWFIVAMKGGGRKVLGKKGKEFREKVVEMHGNSGTLQGRLSIKLDVYPPDRRKRDLDNLLKATLDALEAANIFEDDNQIDEIHMIRKEIVKGGKIMISLEEIK